MRADEIETDMMLRTYDPKHLSIKDSHVHGYGLFARSGFDKGDLVATYEGEIICEEESEKRQAHRQFVGGTNHTVLWSLSNGQVIDGGVGGNETVFLNHSCEPNLEALEEERGPTSIPPITVHFYATREIKAGEELFIDYSLTLGPDVKITKRLVKEYACRCHALNCRDTMLALPEVKIVKINSAKKRHPK